jgi:hypothetical protein
MQLIFTNTVHNGILIHFNKCNTKHNQKSMEHHIMQFSLLNSPFRSTYKKLVIQPKNTRGNFQANTSTFKQKLIPQLKQQTKQHDIQINM